MKDREDKSMGIVTLIEEVLDKIKPSDPLIFTKRSTRKKRKCSDSSGNSPAKICFFLFIIRGKARAKENIYRWVSVSLNERLNTETGRSKTSHIHWVAWVNIQ